MEANVKTLAVPARIRNIRPCVCTREIPAFAVAVFFGDVRNVRVGFESAVSSPSSLGNLSSLGNSAYWRCVAGAESSKPRPVGRLAMWRRGFEESVPATQRTNLNVATTSVFEKTN
jgi:phosphatidate phosphatase APP1